MIELLFTEEIKKDEMDDFSKRVSNEHGFDTSLVYLGTLIDLVTGEREYRLLADCKMIFVHNTFYFDIVSKDVFGIFGGSIGFGIQPNDGLCVYGVEPIEKITNKKRMTFDELLAFIDNYQKENLSNRAK